MPDCLNILMLSNNLVIASSPRDDIHMTFYDPGEEPVLPLTPRESMTSSLNREKG